MKGGLNSIFLQRVEWTRQSLKAREPFSIEHKNLLINPVKRGRLSVGG